MITCHRLQQQTKTWPAQVSLPRQIAAWPCPGWLSCVMLIIKCPQCLPLGLLRRPPLPVASIAEVVGCMAVLAHTCMLPGPCCRHRSLSHVPITLPRCWQPDQGSSSRNDNSTPPGPAAA